MALSPVGLDYAVSLPSPGKGGSQQCLWSVSGAWAWIQPPVCTVPRATGLRLSWSHKALLSAEQQEAWWGLALGHTTGQWVTGELLPLAVTCS